MLVEGSPGIGKTTFCLKIAYDWANGKIPKGCSFPEFNVVLLLKCRDIDGDMIKAIDEQLLPEDDDVKKELRDYIQDIHNQEQVLIILDGLDELPIGAEQYVDRLLHRRMFPFCFLLATSRQERGIEFRQTVNFDVLLQIEGFTDKKMLLSISGSTSDFWGPNICQKERGLSKQSRKTLSSMLYQTIH